MKSPQRAISTVRVSAAHVQCGTDGFALGHSKCHCRAAVRSAEVHQRNGLLLCSRLLTARALAAMSQREGQWMCGRKCDTHLHPFTACSMHHTPCNMQDTPRNVDKPVNVRSEEDLLPVNHDLRDTHMPPADVGQGLSTDQTSLDTVYVRKL